MRGLAAGLRTFWMQKLLKADMKIGAAEAALQRGSLVPAELADGLALY
jgi:hypothetical protein